MFLQIRQVDVRYPGQPRPAVQDASLSLAPTDQPTTTPTLPPATTPPAPETTTVAP